MKKNQNQLAPAYRLIAEWFVYPEDRDSAAIEADLAWLETAPPALRAPLDAFRAAPASHSTEEYVATLELAPPVPLYFGSYLYDEPTTCRGAGMSGRNAYMMELANIYRHFGVEFEGSEMSDFVPVVVEFLAISLEREDADRIGLRRYLVETLLLEATDKLLAALKKFESPYAHLAVALRAALAEDSARMADGPIWQPRPGDERPELTAAGCGFAAGEFMGPEKGVEL